MIIDVSEYQGVIDWEKVKDTPNLEGVYLKACEGVGCPDKQFKNNAAKITALGIPLGVYHFATLNKQDVVTDATQEAQFFINLTKGYKTALPHVLDLEKNLLNLPSDKVLLYVNTFFSVLKKAGLDYAFYSYTPFIYTHLPVNHGLEQVKLWLACYLTQPIFPKGWINRYMWQFRSDGFINGITGHVDLSQKL